MIPRIDERPRTIALRWDGQYEEGRAQAAGIKPGHLLRITADEVGVPVAPYPVNTHNAQGAACVMRVAIEDRLGNVAGTSMGRSIDTEYEDDAIVPFIALKAGDVFMGRVDSDFVAVQGTLLCSAGDGTFEALGGGDLALVQVEENVDFSDTDSDSPSAYERLVRMRVL